MERFPFCLPRNREILRDTPRIGASSAIVNDPADYEGWIDGRRTSRARKHLVSAPLEMHERAADWRSIRDDDDDDDDEALLFPVRADDRLAARSRETCGILPRGKDEMSGPSCVSKAGLSADVDDDDDDDGGARQKMTTLNFSLSTNS